MPDIVIRWLAGLAIIAGLCGVSFMKGCEHERDKWEAVSAKAQAEAEAETSRRLKEKADLVAKYEKERNDAKLSLDRANQSVRGLRDTIADMSRSPAFTVPSNPNCPANELLAECGNRHQSVALRGAELVAECSGRLTEMAGKAEEERGKAELSNSLYESIRKRGTHERSLR